MNKRKMIKNFVKLLLLTFSAILLRQFVSTVVMNQLEREVLEEKGRSDHRGSNFVKRDTLNMSNDGRNVTTQDRTVKSGVRVSINETIQLNDTDQLNYGSRSLKLQLNMANLKQNLDEYLDVDELTNIMVTVNPNPMTDAQILLGDKLVTVMERKYDRAGAAKI